MSLIYFFFTFILLFLLIIIFISLKIFEAFNQTSKIVKANSIKLNRSLVFIILLLIIATGLIVFSVFYSTSYFSNKIDYSSLPKDVNKYELEGLLGDKIGGLMNPFISIAAVIVTGLAFYMQFNANKLIQDQFKVQQFEDQFYEMLQIHNENVRNMEINDSIRGKKCFTRMFHELRLIGKICDYYKNNESISSDNSEQLSDIIYKIFFYGNGPASDKLIDKRKYKIIFDCMNDVIELYDHYSVNDAKYVNIKLSEIIDTQDSFEIDLLYYPFDGHVNRLGTYFRHLYQLISHVAKSEIIKDRNEKYKYIKLIRAQLSNHEQLILYYNSLASFGNAWHEDGFFTEYRLIKNLPFELADFGITPLMKFNNLFNFKGEMVNSKNEPIFEQHEKY